jgi:DHA1 family multidrug resistance protein-like MFS transporter
MSALIILFFTQEEFTPKPGKSNFLKNAVPNFSIIRNIPQLLPLFFIVFTIQLAMSIINPILPLYIQWLTPDVKILGTATGLILSISAVSSALAAALIGKVSDRFGYMRMLGICMAGAVLFYIPQGLASNWTQLLFMRIFDGIFLGGTMPAVNALLAKGTPLEERGSVFGLSTSFSSTGMATGPAIGAVSAAILGYRSVFFITALLITIAWISLLFRRGNHQG